MKPSPADAQDLLLASYRAIGLDPLRHDFRFVEDDWESPTLGAWGLGWEVWCDGMEVGQFTYFQQVGGIPVELPSFEMTYGLERLAMYVAGRGERLRPRLQRRRRDLRRRLPARRARIQRLQLRVRRHRHADRATSPTPSASATPSWPSTSPCRPTTSASRRATCSTCSTRAASSASPNGRAISAACGPWRRPAARRGWRGSARR